MPFSAEFSILTAAVEDGVLGGRVLDVAGPPDQGKEHFVKINEKGKL